MLSWRSPLSYRKFNWSKSMDWFLYDNGFRHERINVPISQIRIIILLVSGLVLRSEAATRGVL